MKKNNKKICFILNFLMIMVCIQNIVFASSGQTSVGVISEKTRTIVNAVAFVGYACASAMLIYVGAKYTLASASERADVKQGLINYLIGAFLIFGASSVASIVAGVLSSQSDVGDMASEIVNIATTL